jgi:hypothetical protein
MTDPYSQAKSVPDLADNACTGLTEADRRALWDAANRLVNARGLAVSLTASLSKTVLGVAGRLDGAGHRVFGSAWDGIEARVRLAVEGVLWKMHDVATIGVGPRGLRDSRTWLHRLSASVSGAASGFAGLPGLLVDVPVTTGLMLRSIARIARDHGEDITTIEGKRACMEVFAQGGPRAESEEAEIGYWSARAGLSHLTIAVLIRTAAARLGVTFSEKLLAQAVPVAGAVAGAGLNWIFMRYYQEIAHVHFTIREVERRAGDAAGVRDCFDRLVGQARALKQAGTGSVIDLEPEAVVQGVE